VHDFIQSRDALALLQSRLDLRALLRLAAGDPLWRFPGPLLGHDQEDLFRYYRRLVTLDYNSSTNVSTLTVQAFRPDDAVRIADLLIGGAETLLNRMNERARADAIRVAEAEVTASRAEALAAEDAMTEYRNREQVVDPLQLSQTVLATIGKLTEDLVTAAAEFDVAVHEAPHSPQLPALRGRIEALQTQIDHERGVLAGSDRSLAPRIGAYERLLLLRGFAEKRYVSALTLLETARLDAERQAAYLERVVTARPPDQARYPFRLLWPVVTLLAGLLLVRLFRPATLLPPRSLHGT
jgi:capsular polysaccharide transport system permease protein